MGTEALADIGAWLVFNRELSPSPLNPSAWLYLVDCISRSGLRICLDLWSVMGVPATSPGTADRPSSSKFSR